MNRSDEGMVSAIEAEPPCKSVSNERQAWEKPAYLTTAEQEGLIDVYKVGCGKMHQEVKLLATAVARGDLQDI